MISGNGDVGNVKYYNGKFDAYQRTYVLMGFKLDAKYLYYYLKESMPKRARDMLNGSAVPYIKLNCITDFEISYPEDIEEQKRIAKVLSDLDRLQELHGLKVQELCKMKDHLMDNKSGIIGTERNRNAVDLRILELSNKLGMSFNNTSSSDTDTRIKLHKESLKNINYKIEVITYVGENEHYDREREFNPRYSLGNI